MTSPNVNWTAYANAYDHMAAYNPAYQHIVQQCLAAAHSWDLQPGDRILDLGAGTGNFSVALAEAFPHVTVVHVDSSEGMCRAAAAKKNRLNLSNLEIHQADVCSIDLAEPSFAAIVSVHNLYTLPNPQAVINQMRRWLKPGGHIFACDAGRPVDVADWTRYILRETRRRYGIGRVLRVLWDARAAITENRKIRRMQAGRTYWLHDLFEFRQTFIDAGFLIEDAALVYRNCSDLLVGRAPVGVTASTV